MFDLLLKNGLVCDGSGAKPFRGDVAVKDGKIAEAAARIDSPAAMTVDVTGLVVSPAFIDNHSHSDGSYIGDERCESKIYQGVATEITGQCGSSLFPRNREQLKRLKENGPEDKFDPGEYYQSENFEKLRERAKADGKRMSTNLVQLVGHNDIRHGVAGLGGRPCTAEENRLSAQILEENLEQGAWGLSLGLEYMPGVFADFNELTELGKICRKHGVVITSHMRNEDEMVFESVDEMVRLSRETGARVNISHLKISSADYFGQADRLFESIEKANREGASVTADMYPYSACSTGIMNTLPDWAKEGGADKAAKRLSVAGEEKDRLLAYLKQRFPAKEDGDRI